MDSNKKNIAKIEKTEKSQKFFKEIPRELKKEPKSENSLVSKYSWKERFETMRDNFLFELRRAEELEKELIATKARLELVELSLSNYEKEKRITKKPEKKEKKKVKSPDINLRGAKIRRKKKIKKNFARKKIAILAHNQRKRRVQNLDIRRDFATLEKIDILGDKP